ncbi:MAG: hypothetical protein KF886_23300 [Candidatus Hydrogenedentes bacterium]|nr:hypothetical protein [Candidatus Hydrogenedentota bacterium]
MSTIFESSDLFEASIRLEDAAASLAQIAETCKLDATDTGSLKWAGDLLRSVDWDFQKDSPRHINPDLAVQATSIRPFFYNVLIESRDQFIAAGISSEEDALDFFRNFYGLLNGEKAPSDISKSHLSLASKFLHEISRGLLLEVTGNYHAGFEHRTEFSTF